jgi:hypothetical protein
MLHSSASPTARRLRLRLAIPLTIWLLGALAGTGCRPDMMEPAPGVCPDRPDGAADASDVRKDGPPDLGDGGGEPGDGGGAPEVVGGGADAAPPEVAGDAPPADGPPLGLDVAPPDLPTPPDLPPDLPVQPTGCGAQAPDVSGIANVDALTIGRDGTIYFAQAGTPDGWIGRLRPGAAPEPRWVSVPQGGMLWGLGTDDSRQRLYVTSASGHLIHFVALGAAQANLQVLTRDVDEPDDPVIGPGGQIYFADSDNHLYRVSPAGELERVTTRTFGENRATGLAFAPDGSLLVGTMANGPLYKLVLTSGTEASRSTLGPFRGFARSLALDSQGGLLVINQVPASESQVVRVGPDGSGGGVVATGTALTGLAFGRGALSCSDLYLASKTGPLRRVTATVPGPPSP